MLLESTADRGLARQQPGDESPILPPLQSSVSWLHRLKDPKRPICFCPTAKVHSCLLAAMRSEAASQMSHVLGSPSPPVLTFFPRHFLGANRSLVIASFMADVSGLSEAERHLLSECRRSRQRPPFTHER